MSYQSLKEISSGFFSFLRPNVKNGLAMSLLVGTMLGMNVNSVQAEGILTNKTGAIQPKTSLQNLPNFVSLVKQVKPAVVSITSRVTVDSADQLTMNDQGDGIPFPFPFPFAPQQMPKQTVEARGSGFIISPDGYVVTNNHVVKNAKKITVSLDNGASLPAKIIGRDQKTDLALLKIQYSKPFPFVQLGDSEGIEPGEWVIAVGDPYGLGGTVTAGIVSARGRDIGDGPYDSFIQVDAPINRGNSGGPLISQDGKVIGVNTAILSPSGGSIGIGFAIPSSTVKNVINQLEKNGHVVRGYLGVSAQAVTTSMLKSLKLKAPDEGMQPKGALVSSVAMDSPAEKGGVKVGDVIMAMNEQSIASPRDLAIKVAGISPGNDVTLKVIREGLEKELKVKIASLSDDQKDQKTPRQQARTNLGIALAPLTPDIRQQVGVDETVKGTVITSVKSGSPADQAGLQPGDVIVGVGETTVSSPALAVDAIRKALKVDTTVLLRILRGGQGLFVPVTTDDDNN